MQIKVKFFAALRELLDCDETVLEVPEGASCEDIFLRLQTDIPALFSFQETCLVAINGTYADKAAYVSAGDEVAILPPVSGG